MRWMIVVCVLASWVAQAASPPASLTMVPKYINYQGRLVAPDGTHYSNTTHSIELRLYETASGSTPVWGSQYSVQTRDGYFSVLLGSAAGVPLPDAPTNELWQTMWKADGSSPDSFYMGVKLLTDADGNDIAEAVEANPRQQFVTSPFAFRAHQSTFASESADEFMAPQGVQTPTVSSSLQVAIEAPTVTVGDNGDVELSVALSGDLTVRNLPLFACWRGSASFSAGVPEAMVAVGLDEAQYDLFVTAWRCTEGRPDGVLMTYSYDPGTMQTTPYARAIFAEVPGRNGTLHVRVLGIRRGLTEGWTLP